MNNPQHYQPLAHALHPPSTSTSSHLQSSYNPSPVYHSKTPSNLGNHNREEEEEDDDNDPDDADEGIVEEQLNRNEAGGQGSSLPPHPVSSNGNPRGAQATQLGQSHESAQEPERKRKPGRPRGSKNRKPRAVSQGTTRQDTQLYQSAGSQPPAAPQHTDTNTPSQQFFEFQWRILNLCAEFYGTAEELVKNTSPVVLAQCYQTGPGSSNDPLKMLTDAKTVCDNLLANPSRLAMSSPTPAYPNASPVYQGPPAQSPTSSQSNSSSSTSANKTTTPIITNPQSFVVPLGAQATYPHAQYPMFPAGATHYPATYYHQYSYAPPSTAFYPQQPILTPAQSQPSLQTQPPVASLQPATPTVGTLSNITSTGLLNQGAWSEEETEKLKKLAEESRTFDSASEIDWDRVVLQYGNNRTRHQILIKATALGLKESSSRGVKRRRETEDDAGPTAPPPPPPPSNTNPTPTTTAPTSASPTHSHATSTPVDSPALQNLQRPATSKGSTLASTPSNLPWPMPTVAVNSPSPVITSPTVDQQQTNYYHPRPGQDTTKPLAHNYMYQPTNGAGARLNKENGK
ncbi:hypothetical protein AX15_004122 [Amanita polypyramis BW_CC]|nr:hypothetical protein AX15_004122 [Amanita polypyramis BW_CC]